MPVLEMSKFKVKCLNKHGRYMHGHLKMEAAGTMRRPIRKRVLSMSTPYFISTMLTRKVRQPENSETLCASRVVRPKHNTIFSLCGILVCGGEIIPWKNVNFFILLNNCQTVRDIKKKFKQKLYLFFMSKKLCIEKYWKIYVFWGAFFFTLKLSFFL